MVGFTNGKGFDARFNNSHGITISPDGTLFIADTYNNTIKKITSDGTVTTLCGSPGRKRITDGKGFNADSIVHMELQYLLMKLSLLLKMHTKEDNFRWNSYNSLWISWRV